MKLGALGGFSDERLVTGTEESRRQARQELQRKQEIHAAMHSGLPEIERSRLRFERYNVVDERTGSLYGLLRGAVDPQMGPAVAYYFDAAGDVRYLEHPPGSARTVAELEAQQAAKQRERAERMTPRSRR